MSGRIMDACDFSFINKAAAAQEREVKESGSNHHRPSPSDEFGWGDAVAGGPTCNNNNINNSSSSSSHIYNTIGYVSSAGSGTGTSMKTLQPFQFDIAAATVDEPPGMAARMGFPFTNAQWRELERQALIYKYMVASVPVPSDLLFPFTRNRNSAAAAAAGPVGLNLIRLSKGGDLEPGRCRRTDGKKWRCSRDVAPDQKYCERHLHRGRPRSRKPVELQPPPNSKKKTRLQSHPFNTTNTVNNNNNLDFSASQLVGNFTQYPHPHIREQRCLDKDWMMKGEAVHLPSHAAGTEWHHLINNSASSVIINQHYHLEEPLNLNSLASFSAEEAQQSNDCPFFIDPDLVPRVFIDAWSNANGVSNGDDQINNTNSGTKSSVSLSGNLSLSPLSLSMGGNNTIDEEMGQLQMGLGLVASSQDHKCGTKPQLSSSLNPDSWAPGGPLAEVLRPSMVPASASGPPSPAAGNGDSDSPPATTVSSPSGVLQKALVSLSDSSGNSSPTPGSSRTNKSEIALLWFGQGKLKS